MKNIILIGFMGSGKTSFGKWICNHYSMDFVDTDEEIVRLENRTINEIFEVEGEEYFRNAETRLLSNMVGTINNHVISMGGGTPIRDINADFLKKLGTVVYLRTTVDTLCKRLANDTTRPLLAGGNLRDKIISLMDKREAVYEKRADLIVDTDELSFEQMYERIKEYENSCN